MPLCFLCRQPLPKSFWLHLVTRCHTCIYQLILILGNKCLVHSYTFTQFYACLTRKVSIFLLMVLHSSQLVCKGLLSDGPLFKYFVIVLDDQDQKQKRKKRSSSRKSRYVSLPTTQYLLAHAPDGSMPTDCNFMLN